MTATHTRIVWTPDTGWTDDGPAARIALDDRGRIHIVPVTDDDPAAMDEAE